VVRLCASRKAEASALEQREYVQRLLDAYRTTPGTVGVVRGPDHLFAAQLHERAVPLDVAENALAVARRLARPADAPPLGVIRSLAYFAPVIEEVLQTSPSLQYFHHLRQRIQKSSQPVKPPKQQTQDTPSAWMILPWLAPVSCKDAPYGADDER
jgi:hypothetical protein